MIDVVIKILILVKRFIPINKKYSYLRMEDVINLSLTNSKIHFIFDNFYKFRILNKYPFAKRLNNCVLLFDKLISSKIPIKILNLIDLDEEITEDIIFINLFKQPSKIIVKCNWLLNKNKSEIYFDEIFGFRKIKDENKNIVTFKKLFLEKGWILICKNKLTDLLEQNLHLSTFDSLLKISNVGIFYYALSLIKETYLDSLIEYEIEVENFNKTDEFYANLFNKVKDERIVFDDITIEFARNLLKFVNKKSTYRNFKNVFRIPMQGLWSHFSAEKYLVGHVKIEESRTSPHMREFLILGGLLNSKGLLLLFRAFSANI